MKESRRQFLKKSACAMGMATIAAQMGSFGMMNALANSMAVRGANDYKALVLIFLAGGNDGNNTVVPKHDNIPYFGISNYDDYASNRGVLAIPRGSLLPVTPPSLGLEYGFHPSFGSLTGNGGNAGIHGLFNDGKLAVVANVGTLVYPTTRTDYLNSSHQMPLQLFSHADQVAQQQSAYADGTDYKGWGGRISNLITPVNPSNAPSPLPLLTSIAGSQLFITGGPTPLVLADGKTPLSGIFSFNHNGGLNYPSTIGPAFEALVTPSPSPSPSPHNFVKEANTITKRAIDVSAQFAGNTEITNPEAFPNTSIGQQLLQVARVIKLSRGTSLSNRITDRQIFFCQLGGFDTHSHQLAAQAGLLLQFSQAVRAFYDEMVEQGANSDVTTFTMSDFGRTLRPNGNTSSAGTDHAWGNHQFVIGGAVNGGNFYGHINDSGASFPRMAVDAGDDTDTGLGASGRWVPTTAVEEYAAVLAKWFGVKTADLGTVFPNYSHFTNRQNVGIMNFLP